MGQKYIGRKWRGAVVVLFLLGAVLGVARLGTSSSLSPEDLAGQECTVEGVAHGGAAASSSQLWGLWTSMVSRVQGLRHISLLPKPAKPLVYKVGSLRGPYAKGLNRLFRLKSWNGESTDHPLLIASGALEDLSKPEVRAAVRQIFLAGHPIVVEDAGQSEVDWVSALQGRPSILTLSGDHQLDFFVAHRGRSLSIETEGVSDRDRIPLHDQRNVLKENLATMLAEEAGASSLQVRRTGGTPLAHSGTLRHPAWFGLLAPPFLSPGDAVAQSGTLELLELALPSGGSLYEYTQQYNVLLQFGGDDISGSPQSCTNTYEVSYVVYPIHSASNADYFAIVSNGVSQPFSCSKVFSANGLHKSDRATDGYYAKAWVYAAAVSDYVNDPTNLSVDQGITVPQSTQITDSYSQGVSWNVGGTGTVGYQQGQGFTGSVAFNAGVSYSNTNTYDLPAVSITNASLSDQQVIGGGPVGSGDNIVQWLYNFQGATSGNGCCPGNLSNPVSPSSTSSSQLPMFWVWKTSSAVRSYYTTNCPSGASSCPALPIRSVLAPSVEVTWLGSGPDALYTAANGDIIGVAPDTGCACGTHVYEFPCAKWNTDGCQNTTPTDVHSDITFNIPFAPTS